MVEHDPISGRASSRGEPAREHVVQFYDEDGALLHGVAAFLADGLLRGAPALVFIVRKRAELLQQRLAEMGVDVERCLRSQLLVIQDSIETVERMLVGGMPDDRRFRQAVAAQVVSMNEIWRPLRPRAFGDMVDVLVARGRSDAAIELERMWDELAHRLSLAIYCAYDARRFSHERDRAVFDAICSHHGSIIPVQGARAATESELPAS